MGDKPIGIQVCAILFAAVRLLTILGGIVTFLIGSGIVDIGGHYTEIVRTFVGMISVLVAIMLAAIIIVAGVVGLIIAYGIWKTKKWARIAGIILAIIGGAVGFPTGTIVALIILYFLLIDKNTKILFTN